MVQVLLQITRPLSAPCSHERWYCAEVIYFVRVCEVDATSCASSGNRLYRAIFASYCASRVSVCGYVFLIRALDVTLLAVSDAKLSAVEYLNSLHESLFITCVFSRFLCRFFRSATHRRFDWRLIHSITDSPCRQAFFETFFRLFLPLGYLVYQ